MMQTYVPYCSSISEIKMYLKSHLYNFANVVNINECARAVVYDYFSSRFSTPFPHTLVNGSNIYLNDKVSVQISNEDYAYIGSVINGSFWTASKLFAYLLNHCGKSPYQSVPTDCYFSIDANDDILVYVPLHNTVPDVCKQMAVPESALIFAVKGGV